MKIENVLQTAVQTERIKKEMDCVANTTKKNLKIDVNVGISFLVGDI